MPYPPYSPDLPKTTFFFLFHLWKKSSKENLFINMEEVKQKIAEVLKGIKIYEFKNCFEQWKKYPDWYVASNGEYFEGEWSLNT